jgi:uncharacterized protein
MDIDFKRLWAKIASPFRLHGTSIHGPEHWRRVERNGLLLCAESGARQDVVRLFALFHDSCRINDGWDPGHGARGAEYAAELRGSEFELDNADFELLRYACAWHTSGRKHDDATIATCWDADRLDLGRVGIIPDPARMCTKLGREIAAAGTVERYLELNGEV